MKIKRVYLHIGMTKTGSSALQTTFEDNRELLFEHNIYYAHNNYQNEGLIGQNHNFLFASLFLEKSVYPEVNEYMNKNGMDFEMFKKFSSDYWEKNINEAKKRSIDNFVISAELLSFSDIHIEEIIAIKEFLVENFEEIHVIGYIREFRSWLSSQYQEEIKLGFCSNVDEAMDNTIFNYFPNLSLWKEVFGDTFKLRMFDRKNLYNGDIFDDFINVINISVPNEITREVANQALSLYSVEFLYKYNQKYPFLVGDVVNEKRGGLGINKRVPDHLYKDNTFKYECKASLNESQIEFVSKIYEVANNMFGENILDIDKLKIVEEEGEEVELPIDFFIELINNYNFNLGALRHLKFSNAAKFDEINKLIKDEAFRTLFLRVENLDVTHSLVREFNELSGEIKFIKGNLYQIRFNSNREVADAYRDLALCLESAEDYEQAYRFMRIAKILRHDGPFINEKTEEYKRVIKEDNACKKLEDFSEEFVEQEKYSKEELVFAIGLQRTLADLMSKKFMAVTVFLIKGLLTFNKEFYQNEYKGVHWMVGTSPRKHFLCVGYPNEYKVR